VATVTYQISARANDGKLDQAGTFSGTADYCFYLGKYSTNSMNIYLRFTGVAIPKGATISSAYIQYRSWNPPQTGTAKVNVYANDVANASNPTSASDFNAKVLTTAVVNWSVPALAQSTWGNSAELKTVVQEVINRSDWASGNALMLMIFYDATSTTYQQMDSYDNSSTYAPKLVITYTADTTPPANVTNTSASKSTNGVLLSWTNPTDTDFSYCKIYIGSNSIATNITTNSYEDTANGNSSQITYKITTVDFAGNESTGVNVTYTPPVEALQLTAGAITSSSLANDVTLGTNMVLSLTVGAEVSNSVTNTCTVLFTEPIPAVVLSVVQSSDSEFTLSWI
jgi:hypothetical protein